MLHINETLRLDHERFDERLERLRQSAGASESARRELCRSLRAELAAHTRLEEEHYYPAVRDCGTGVEGLIDRAVHDHRKIEDLLARLEEPGHTPGSFTDAVTELRNVVRDHALREEELMFPIAADGLDAEKKQEMTRRHDALARELARDIG